MMKRSMLTAAVLGLFAVGPETVLLAAPDLRLQDAVQRQDRNAIRTLLKEQVDVNARRADGATALAFAVHLDDLETVDLLIRAGADVNAANDLDITPLMLAAVNGNAAI